MPLDFIDLPVAMLIAGTLGIFVVRKNIVLMLLSLELMLLGTSFNFVLLSLALDDILGEVFAILIVTVAGSESALGLALFVALYRLRNTVDADAIRSLKG